MLGRRMEPVDPVFKPALTKSLGTCRRGHMSIFDILIPLLFLASLLLHSLHSLAHSGDLNDAFWKKYR